MPRIELYPRLVLTASMAKSLAKLKRLHTHTTCRCVWVGLVLGTEVSTLALLINRMERVGGIAATAIYSHSLVHYMHDVIFWEDSCAPACLLIC